MPASLALAFALFFLFPALLALLALGAQALMRTARQWTQHDLRGASVALRCGARGSLARAVAGHAMRGSRTPMVAIVARWAWARIRALYVTTSVQVRVEARILAYETARFGRDVAALAVGGAVTLTACLGGLALAMLPYRARRGAVVAVLRLTGQWGALERLL